MVEGKFAGHPPKTWLRNLAKQALVAQGAGAKAELGLVITGQRKIRQLNKTYLGEDRPTDVLSFQMREEISGASFVTAPDRKEHLGEVIISYPQAVIQAGEHGHPVKKEIAILIIHGILHLLGYDHEEAVQERQMRSREAAILKVLEKVIYNDLKVMP